MEDSANDIGPELDVRRAAFEMFYDLLSDPPIIHDFREGAQNRRIIFAEENELDIMDIRYVGVLMQHDAVRTIVF